MNKVIINYFYDRHIKLWTLYITDVNTGYEISGWTENFGEVHCEYCNKESLNWVIEYMKKTYNTNLVTKL